MQSHEEKQSLDFLRRSFRASFADEIIVVVDHPMNYQK